MIINHNVVYKAFALLLLLTSFLLAMPEATIAQTTASLCEGHLRNMISPVYDTGDLVYYDGRHIVQMRGQKP